MWHPFQHWLAYMTGSLNTSGAPPNYNFWSGFGSDLTELALLGGLVSVYRRHNCGIRWCWRIARHDLTEPGTGLVHRLCRRHHPDHPGRATTAAELRRACHLYLGDRPGKG